MPQGLADDAQSEVRYYFFTDASNHFDIAKEVCRTAFRVYQPLSADVHDDRLGLLSNLPAKSASTLRF